MRIGTSSRGTWWVSMGPLGWLVYLCLTVCGWLLVVAVRLCWAILKLLVLGIARLVSWGLQLATHRAGYEL